MKGHHASLIDHYSALEYAHHQALRRNDHLVEAHKLLSTQYQQLTQELTVLATRHRLLQREVTEMQTDALAHEAVAWQYERQLATHHRNAKAPRESDLEPKMLLVKIKGLEEENADMRKALNGASELLMASRNGQRMLCNGPT